MYNLFIPMSNYYGNLQNISNLRLPATFLSLQCSNQCSPLLQFTLFYYLQKWVLHCQLQLENANVFSLFCQSELRIEGREHAAVGSRWDAVLGSWSNQMPLWHLFVVNSRLTTPLPLFPAFKPLQTLL